LIFLYYHIVPVSDAGQKLEQILWLYLFKGDASPQIKLK
jgi:hypothetical protein